MGVEIGPRGSIRRSGKGPIIGFMATSGPRKRIGARLDLEGELEDDRLVSGIITVAALAASVDHVLRIRGSGNSNYSTFHRIIEIFRLSALEAEPADDSFLVGGVLGREGLRIQPLLEAGKLRTNIFRY